MDDQRLHDLMRHPCATVDPPTHRLVEAGLRNGRRQRRRIRAAEFATGAAVGAGIAVLGATFLSGSGGRRGTVAEPAGHGAGGAGGTVTMTSPALLQTALDTLPRPGRTSGYSGAFLDGFLEASFRYDDGHGAAAVNVSMAYRADHPTPKNVTAPAACKTRSAGCTVFRDGSHAQVDQRHQYEDGRT